MRQTTAFIVLVLLVTGLACHGKPRRNMRPDDMQIYDLPPMDAEWASRPPDYPKEEGLIAPAKDKNSPKSLGGGGMPGGGGGGGMGAGGMGAGGMGAGGMGNGIR